MKTNKQTWQFNLSFQRHSQRLPLAPISNQILSSIKSLLVSEKGV